MLSLNLAPIFRMRGIEKPYSFLVKARRSQHSATKILNDMTQIFRLDHVGLLCDLFVCEPNDLLAWKPDKTRLPRQLPAGKIEISTGRN
ncbi:MAG TPA: helix-turn-helix domain-containing protein [Saprospiraceae bacterium]|nr:helix-turn-helix domain-containing protein [Saprospiraceae bacterium]